METIESILDDARRPITARELSSDLAIASSAAKECVGCASVIHPRGARTHAYHSAPHLPQTSKNVRSRAR